MLPQTSSIWEGIFPGPPPPPGFGPISASRGVPFVPRHRREAGVEAFSGICPHLGWLILPHMSPYMSAPQSSCLISALSSSDLAALVLAWDTSLSLGGGHLQKVHFCCHFLSSVTFAPSQYSLPCVPRHSSCTGLTCSLAILTGFELAL